MRTSNKGPKRKKRAVQRTDVRAENKDLRKRLREAAASARDDEDRAAAAKTRHSEELDLERGLRHAAQHDSEEIRHRLKNTIAIIQAIANATLVKGVAIEQARRAFNERLAALAAAHDILFDAGWTTANLDAVIKGVLAPYRSHRIRSKGPAVALGPKPALAFALALHELGTNASKYGALSVDDGYVDIAWILAPTPAGEELRLRWHERNGPKVTPPKRQGFGSRLIRHNLASEFGGKVELDFEPDGLDCTICAPVAHLQ
jgi:two-component sensor histidine kinase